MEPLDIARFVGASFYFVEFVAYAVGTILAPEGRQWHPLRGILYDNLVVTGLNMLLYSYLASGGSPDYIFLVYAFSCVYLAISMLRVLTLRAYLSTIAVLGTGAVVSGPNGVAGGDALRYTEARRDQLNNLSILIFVTLITGFIIVLLPDLTVRYTLFVLDFVPFGLALVLLVTEANRFNRTQAGTSAAAAPSTLTYILVYGTLLVWVGYPIVMLLGPEFTAVLSATGRDTGYISLDVVTKHLFMAASAAITLVTIREVGQRGAKFV